MKKVLRIWIIFISIHTVALAQDRTGDSVPYLSQLLKQNLKKYNALSDDLYDRGEIEKGEALFDSLVQHALVGAQFDDFTFKSVKGRKIKLSKLKRPTFIITYASWSIIPKGEIAALNKLAKEYQDEIQFIVLFWNQKHHIKKNARHFSSRIRVCYANERYQNDARAVRTLKHSFGFPTCYYIDEHMQLRGISRGGLGLPPKTPLKKALEQNYALFKGRIEQANSNQENGIASPN